MTKDRNPERLKPQQRFKPQPGGKVEMPSSPPPRWFDLGAVGIFAVGFALILVVSIV